MVIFLYEKSTLYLRGDHPLNFLALYLFTLSMYIFLVNDISQLLINEIGQGIQICFRIF